MVNESVAYRKLASKCTSKTAFMSLDSLVFIFLFSTLICNRIVEYYF